MDNARCTSITAAAGTCFSHTFFRFWWLHLIHPESKLYNCFSLQFINRTSKNPITR